MTPPFGAAARRLIATSFLLRADFETSASDNLRQPILSLLHFFSSKPQSR